jgi:Mg-chelatase subunit ChlD
MKRHKSKAQASKQKETLINFILDETGSMMPHKEKTISAFNEYVSALKSKTEPTKMSLTKFNSTKIEVVYADKSINDVPKLNEENYHPDNLTPLYDAIGKTVTDVSAKTKEKDQLVLVAILTDGEENASKEYSKAGIKKLIEEKEKAGWTFVYLGANQDAFAEGSSLGVARGNIQNFDMHNIKPTMMAMASSTRTFRAGGIKTKQFFK